MLETAGTDLAVFPPTVLYNEGWMLRIILLLLSEGIKCLPSTPLTGAKWFSEAQIGSPFLPRFRRDPLAENLTHIDAVIGHFDFRSETKTGLTLTADSIQFVVIEAKMFSPLSRGTKNAPYYDQAARIVACIAWTIEQSSKAVKDFTSLAFHVLAPYEQIMKGKFSAQMKKKSIYEKVERRIDAYSGDDEKIAELQLWHSDFFIPTLELIDLRCISWESAIDAIGAVDHERGSVIRNFYDRCLKFNAPASKI